MALFYQARTFEKDRKKMKLLPKTQKLRVDPMFLKIIHTPVNDKTILETVMLRREDEKDGVAPWLRTTDCSGCGSGFYSGILK